MPDPPPDVNFSELGEVGAGKHTKREELIVHNENPSCAGCHKLMDPIGLTLEHFDGAGEYRQTDDGLVIDASGELDGSSYNDSKGLGEAVHDHPMLPSCLVSRVYAYGTGGPSVGRRDWPITEHLTEQFADSDFRWPDLLRSVILTPAFTNVRQSPDLEGSETEATFTLEVTPAAGSTNQKQQSGLLADAAAYSID